MTNTMTIEDKKAILKAAGISIEEILSALGLDNKPGHEPYTTRDLADWFSTPIGTMRNLVKQEKFGTSFRVSREYRVIAKNIRESIINFVVIPDGALNLKAKSKESNNAKEKVLDDLRLKDAKDSFTFNSENLAELFNCPRRTIQSYIKRGVFGPYLKIGRLNICISKWVKQAVIRDIVGIEDNKTAMVTAGNVADTLSTTIPVQI